MCAGKVDYLNAGLSDYAADRGDGRLVLSHHVEGQRVFVMSIEMRALEATKKKFNMALNIKASLD